jgi:hypothetical protein
VSGKPCSGSSSIGLDLPAKCHNGDVAWRRPHCATIHRMIENPIYGGAYAYGMSRVATGYDAGARHRDQLREHPRLGLRFGRRLTSALRRRRPRPGDKWLMDEVFIRIRGRQHHLRRKVDQDGHVLDILMQKSGL